MTNTDDPDVNAEDVKWGQFENDVWRKCKDWFVGLPNPGSLSYAVKEYPTLKFKYYHVYDGPSDTEGTWAVADDVVIREEDTLKGKMLHYRTRPKP